MFPIQIFLDLKDAENKAQGTNHYREFFDSSFYWKLGYNLSLSTLDWLSSVSGNLSQNDLKPALLTSPMKKNEIQNFPIFLSMRSRRVAAPFEGLNSSLAQSPCELQSCRKIAAHCVISQYEYLIHKC